MFGHASVISLLWLVSLLASREGGVIPDQKVECSIPRKKIFSRGCEGEDYREFVGPLWERFEAQRRWQKRRGIVTETARGAAWQKRRAIASETARTTAWRGGRAIVTEMAPGLLLLRRRFGATARRPRRVSQTRVATASLRRGRFGAQARVATTAP